MRSFKGDRLIFLVICYLVLTGCYYNPYSNRFPSVEEIRESGLRYSSSFNVDLSKANYSDKNIDVSFKPAIGEFGLYKLFDLTIVNKSKYDIKLIWDETYFIENGSTNGKFLVEGVRYIERESSRLPDIILSDSTFNKELYPNARIFKNVIGGGWTHTRLDSGDYGIYLTLQIGKEIKHIKLFAGLHQ